MTPKKINSCIVMLKIYLFRKININFDHYPNPYIVNLESSLSTHFEIVNKDDNQIGVLDLFKYFFKTDIFYFNWIENLHLKRFGKIQSVIFLCFLLIAKFLKRKILWTLHNKHSHDNGPDKWTGFMYKILAKYSDVILTHSQVGVEFFKSKYPKYGSKIKYIVHPVGDILPSIKNQKKTYDIFIWGSIQPYKGVVEFLEFVNLSASAKFLKILVVGKCFNKSYEDKLINCLSDNIDYKNEFYALDQISIFASQAKYTLFTYKTESILSSGSLMDSLRMRSIIIGPNDGAFKDLSCYGFVILYNDFQEIIELCKKDDITSYISEMEIFCVQNTWELFGNKIDEELNTICL